MKLSKLATLQMTSDSGHPNLLTAKTGDPLWRLVRKGVAPAFNPQNIRCRTSFDELSPQQMHKAEDQSRQEDKKATIE